MTEDKRVLKTKTLLKNTFVNMLSKKTFEKITIKELCETANTSRITFYKYYNDKYDLVDDISSDMIKSAQEEYKKLQKQNNPQKDSILSYCNFLDCILNIYYKNIHFFTHTSPHENPYLNFSFYKYILKYLEIHTQKRSHILKPKYGIKKIASFLCYGLWGFINEANHEKCSIEQVKMESHEILKKMLHANILTEKSIT